MRPVPPISGPGALDQTIRQTNRSVPSPRQPTRLLENARCQYVLHRKRRISPMRSNLYNRSAAAHKVEMHLSPLSRREFLIGTAGLITSALCNQAAETTPEPVIDIHQHTTYGGRTNDQLIAHQKMMGVTHTVLLPGGRLYGLDAGCGRNDTVVELSGQRASDYSFFANEIP